MRRIVTLVLLIGCYSLPLFSQDCSCSKNLSELEKKIQDNYAGFSDKVNSKTSKTYTSFVESLKRKALNLDTGRACHRLLIDYVKYFKDKHLVIQDLPSNNPVIIEKRKLDVEATYKYFKNLRQPATDIRGIWENESYKLAILNKENSKTEFVAVVLSSKIEEWKPGMIKIYLKKVKDNFYEIDFMTSSEKFNTKAYFNNNILDIFLLGVFTKSAPTSSFSIDPANYSSVFPDTDIKFSFPNDSVAQLFIGSFNNQYERVIDSLMELHKAELEKRAYWIIDLSYNSGGGIGTYKSLLPYIYTNPIYRSGSYYRLSPDNIANFENFLREKTNLPKPVENFFSNLI